MSVDKVTLKDIYDAVDGLRNDIATNYVTKDAFEPVKNIVYGLVAVILLAVVSAIIGLAVHTATENAPAPHTTVQVNPDGSKK